MRIAVKDAVGRPEKLFLVIGGVFGLLFLVCTPPFQVADEDAHYYRAYQIAEGGVVSEIQDGRAGAWLPASVVECGSMTKEARWHLEPRMERGKVLEAFSERLAPSERVFVGFRSASYSPVAYLPAALAMRVGIWMEASPVGLMYLGRLANLAVWLCLIHLAIRILPFHKELFFLLALTPTSLYQGASLSADSMTNGLAFLVIAYVLYLGFSEVERVSGKSLALLFVMMVSLVLTKNYLFLFPFFVFLIPSKRFGGWKRRFWCFAGLVGVSLAAVFAWWLIVRGLPIYWRPEVVPEEQMAHIARHPLGFLSILAQTVVKNWHWYCARYVGAFGWQSFHISKWHSILWMLLLVAAALTGGRRDVRIRGWQKGVLVSVAGVTTMLVFTLLYCYWNPVGASEIVGGQGRYFVALVPLLLLALDNRRFCMTDRRWRMPVFAGATIVSLVISLMLMTERFWAGA